LIVERGENLLELIILIAGITVLVILPLVIRLALSNTDDNSNYSRKSEISKWTIEDYYLASKLAR
jgi:hypothetical protein